ncbi:MAG: dihydroorotase [Myxococcales bacterium]|nr:dihydroorotase [Myxococcales bacterium]
MPAPSLAIRGGHVVLPGEVRRLDIGIEGGRIVELDLPLRASYPHELDATGLHALPGAIDTQVHFREPGLEWKEDLATGSEAAAAGGVTTFFEMPNTRPPTTTPEAFDDKLLRASGRCRVDYAFFVGATPDNADTLGQFEKRRGFAGIKVFMGSSTGSLLVPDDASLRRVLAAGRCRVAVHAEDEPRLQALAASVAVSRPHDHALRRDEECARRAVQRLLDLAAETLRPVHILHVTSAAEVDLLRTHPARRLATAEVTPQHLLLAAPDCYDRLGARAVMNPPIRDESHRVALWQGLRDGVLTCIGTDHAPHTLEEKALGYPGCPSGMPGVQTLLPLLLNEVAGGRVSLEDIALWTAQRPAQVFQIVGKGGLLPGLDADIALCDLSLQRTVTADLLRSRCGWSPWEGESLQGWPRITIVRGHVVWRDDAPVGDPIGEPVRCADAVPILGR